MAGGGERVPYPGLDGGGEGGTPSQVWGGVGTLSRSGWWGGGTPSQVWGGGYSIPGVGGYPSQVWMVGGIPSQRVGEGYLGYPLARSGWWGVPGYPPPSRSGWSTIPWYAVVPPLSRLGWGTPHPGMGYTPPDLGWGTPTITTWPGYPPHPRPGMGYPPPWDGVHPPPDLGWGTPTY